MLFVLETVSIVGSADTGMADRSDPSKSPSLYDHLERLGYQLTSDTNGLFLISFNHDARSYRRFIKNGGKAASAVLIRLEPDAVFPAQYGPRIEKKYGLIISPGSRIDYLNKSFFVGWPYQYHLNPAKPERNDPSLQSILENSGFDKRFNLETWIQRPSNIVMIAGNKVSPTKSANYKLRRNLVRYLPPGFIQVYGPLWDSSLKTKLGYRFWLAIFTIKNGYFPNLVGIYGNLLRNYPAVQGAVEDKHHLLQQSKFSLVIENSNSFVSEKIFDSILNGAIPIYVGPNLQDVGLPIELVIKSIGNPKEIISELDNFDNARALAILTEMKHFIRSQYFRENWTSEFVWDRVSKEIHSYFTKLRSCS